MGALLSALLEVAQSLRARQDFVEYLLLPCVFKQSSPEFTKNVVNKPRIRQFQAQDVLPVDPRLDRANPIILPYRSHPPYFQTWPLGFANKIIDYGWTYRYDNLSLFLSLRG